MVGSRNGFERDLHNKTICLFHTKHGDCCVKKIHNDVHRQRSVYLPCHVSSKQNERKKPNVVTSHQYTSLCTAEPKLFLQHRHLQMWRHRISSRAKGLLFKMNVHVWKRVCGKQHILECFSFFFIKFLFHNAEISKMASRVAVYFKWNINAILTNEISFLGIIYL